MQLRRNLKRLPKLTMCSKTPTKERFMTSMESKDSEVRESVIKIGGGGAGPSAADFESMFSGFGHGFGPGFSSFGGRGGGFGDSDFGGHFSFKRANDIFKEFFGGHDPFADFMDDDAFFGGSGMGKA